MTIESASRSAELREITWKSPQAGPRSSRVERMQYRAPGTVSVPATLPTAGDGTGSTAEAAAADPGMNDLEARLAAAERAAIDRIEAARREGHECGLSEAGERARESLSASLGRIEAALGSLQTERDAYFARVEIEVVRLALGIAARVLNREAQMDPLLLSGAVRVALGQLGEATAVRLRVPASEIESWNEMLRLLPNLPLRPEVVGDGGLGTGDCVLETQVGTVDLGVKAQLAEIERGFFDLLEQRPSGQRPG